MFHEMLHLRHPVQHRGARRCVHTPEFKQAEKEVSAAEGSERSAEKVELNGFRAIIGRSMKSIFIFIALFVCLAAGFAQAPAGFPGTPGSSRKGLEVCHGSSQRGYGRALPG